VEEKGFQELSRLERQREVLLETREGVEPEGCRLLGRVLGEGRPSTGPHPDPVALQLGVQAQEILVQLPLEGLDVLPRRRGSVAEVPEESRQLHQHRPKRRRRPLVLRLSHFRSRPLLLADSTRKALPRGCWLEISHPVGRPQDCVALPSSSQGLS
jgi:hypothetical protein